MWSCLQRHRLWGSERFPLQVGWHLLSPLEPVCLAPRAWGTQPALGLPQPCLLLCRRPRLPKGHGHRVRSSPHSLGGASRSIEAGGKLGAPPEEPGGRGWLWAVFLESSGQQTSLFPFVLGLAWRSPHFLWQSPVSLILASVFLDSDRGSYLGEVGGGRQE